MSITESLWFTCLLLVSVHKNDQTHVMLVLLTAFVDNKKNVILHTHRLECKAFMSSTVHHTGLIVSV